MEKHQKALGLINTVKRIFGMTAEWLPIVDSITGEVWYRCERCGHLSEVLIDMCESCLARMSGINGDT